MTAPIDIILHNSMKLRGCSKGTITSDYQFVVITSNTDQAQQLETLLKIKEWISTIDIAKVLRQPRSYKGVRLSERQLTRYVMTTLFGILEGLVRDTRLTLKREHGGMMGTGMVK
ncbi:hypothetical protein RRF57_009908 [Xylaria bambusicola]|uniref:Uncharacterized protein n=1 Tax=Xylaria bambusicola TaxID=326684 RepID=A0AAN7UU63_9PEZI